MSILWSTNIFYKISKLFTECCEDFIFVFHGVWPRISLTSHPHVGFRFTVKEWYKFVSCALRPKSKRNGGQSVDGIQPQQHVVMLRAKVSLEDSHRDFDF